MADTALVNMTVATAIAGSDLLYAAAEVTGSPTSPVDRAIQAHVLRPLIIATGSDANTTLAANKTYLTPMTGWATADRSYTLPANPSVGDWVELVVTSGNATYECLLKTNTGQTAYFNGASVAASTEITRVFITGERLQAWCVATDTWMIFDGRIAMYAEIVASSGVSLANNTLVRPGSGSLTASHNIGSVWETGGTNPVFRSRRATKSVLFNINGASVAFTSGSVKLWYVRLETDPNGTPATVVDHRYVINATERLGSPLSHEGATALDSTWGMAFLHTQGSTQTTGVLRFTASEKLR